MTLELLGGEIYVENQVKFTVVVDIADIPNLEALLAIRLSKYTVWPGIAQRVAKILPQVGCIDMLRGVAHSVEQVVLPVVGVQCAVGLLS